MSEFITMAADSTQADTRPNDKKTAKKRKKASSSKKSKKVKKTSDKYKKKRVESPHESDSESDLDLDKVIKPIRGYLRDRLEMVAQMFMSIGESKLRSMLPEILKVYSVEELKTLCQEQLEIMSRKRIRRILDGDNPANISSSGTESDTWDEDEEERMEADARQERKDTEPRESDTEVVAAQEEVAEGSGVMDGDAPQTQSEAVDSTSHSIAVAGADVAKLEPEAKSVQTLSVDAGSKSVCKVEPVAAPPRRRSRSRRRQMPRQYRNRSHSRSRSRSSRDSRHRRRRDSSHSSYSRSRSHSYSSDSRSSRSRSRSLLPEQDREDVESTHHYSGSEEGEIRSEPRESPVPSDVEEEYPPEENAENVEQDMVEPVEEEGKLEDSVGSRTVQMIAEPEQQDEKGGGTGEDETMGVRSDIEVAELVSQPEQQHEVEDGRATSGKEEVVNKPGPDEPSADQGVQLAVGHSEHQKELPGEELSTQERQVQAASNDKDQAQTVELKSQIVVNSSEEPALPKSSTSDISDTLKEEVSDGKEETIDKSDNDKNKEGDSKENVAENGEKVANLRDKGDESLIDSTGKEGLEIPASDVNVEKPQAEKEPKEKHVKGTEVDASSTETKISEDTNAPDPVATSHSKSTETPLEAEKSEVAGKESKVPPSAEDQKVESSAVAAPQTARSSSVAGGQEEVQASSTAEQKGKPPAQDKVNTPPSSAEQVTPSSAQLVTKTPSAAAVEGGPSKRLIPGVKTTTASAKAAVSATAKPKAGSAAAVGGPQAGRTVVKPGGPASTGARSAAAGSGPDLSKTQMEILELEMRARAIKAMLKRQQQPK